MTSRETFTNNYNTNSSAIRRISINETINAELEEVGDHNWFAISLSEGESYEFNLIGNNLRDTYLQLRNENGDIITRDDDSGFGLNSRITFQPTYTGTYYLDAGSYQNLYAGTYSLSTEQTSPQSTTPNNSIDSGDAAFSISDSPSIVAILSAQQRSSDPNSDDIYSADRSTTGRIGIDETLNAELEEIGDRDWFAISLSEGENYEFNLIGNNLRDTYLYLRDDSGAIIIYNDDGGSGLNSRISFQSTYTGIYYLDAGSYHNNYSGAYSLSSTHLSALPESPPTGESPSNDVISADPNTSGRVQVNETIHSEIDETGDRDWFAISLEAGTIYEFNLTGGSLGDTCLNLVNSSGDIVAHDDDGGSALNSRISFQSTYTGTYYLDAGSYQNLYAGTYSLSTEQTSPPSTPPNDSIDSGDAAFSITGSPGIDAILSAQQHSSDPDGDGSFSHLWQSSTDGITWTDLFTADQLTVSSDLEGKQLRLSTSYTDAQGFDELITSNSITIPFFDHRDADYSADRSTTGRIGIDETLNAELEEIGDRDWFAISLSEGENYEFNLIGNNLRDTYLYLRDDSGAIIIYNDDGGSGLNSRISFQSTYTGIYYLDAGSYHNNYSGAYSLSSTHLSALPESPPTGESPSNDVISADPNTSGRVQVNETIHSEIDETGDRDWFAISLEAGTIYEFNLTGGSLGDTYLNLVNSSGDIVAHDDDGGSALNSRISFQSTYTGTYYLDAGSYQNLYAGTYLLSTEQTSPPSTPPNDSIDSGDAAFSITGSPGIDAILSAQQHRSDPDGDGSFSHLWQSSTDGITWTDLFTADQLTVSSDLEGKQLRLSTSYTDAQGFDELITSNSITIPFFDHGDAAFSITGSPGIDAILSAQQHRSDPDGDGSFSHLWQSSTDGITWTDLFTADQLTVSSDLEGKQLRLSTSYTDAQGFDELITSNSITIPFFDHGDAAFSITGSPGIDTILSAQQHRSDPDGDGSFSHLWQSSTDGITWTDLFTADQLTVSSDLEGKQLRLSTSYTDAQGFDELITSNSITIPFFDHGDAAFSITGSPGIDTILSAQQHRSDPDGDGSFSHLWQSSTDGITWTDLFTADQLTVSSDLEGKQLRLSTSYTDAQGFDELITSNSITIPFFDHGDAAFSITGSPGIDAILSAQQHRSDPDGDGSFSHLWQSSTDGITWTDLFTADQLTVSSDLEGKQLRLSTSYTDAQGFDELITSNSITIPFFDHGDAAFSITGSPGIDTILSAQQHRSDPDGDGSFSHLWQSSTDGITWTDLFTADQLTVSSDLEGKQLRLSTSYTDAQGFDELITSNSITIPFFDHRDADYSADRSTTGRIGIDETLNAELEEIGDRDWFAISLSEGENYEFNLIGNTLIDPYLYLRGESGSIISHNDDIIEGINRNSSLTFTPSNTEIYYLDVGAWQDNYTGSYALSTRRLPQSDPGFSAIDGWGEVSAKRAFERLLNITIPYVANLGGNLWGVDNVDAPEVRSNNSTFPGATGEGVTIAVIDTGVDLDHPEFNGRITDGYDFVDNDVIADDGHGHGTHIAGTIAGNNNDQIGISGVAPDAQIMPIRVLDNRGNGSIANVIEGIIWATDNGADVLNLSLGGGGYSQAMSDAIAYASSNNAVVVMAAGNSGGLSPDYPAVHAINHGIAVGALDQNRNMASFSNRAGNETLDYLTAPGVNIYSSVPNGSYSKMSGTSMATPHVAGIAALLKSHDSSLTANEIEDLLTGTASNAQLLSNREETTDSLTGSTIGLTRNLITLDTLDQFTQEQLGTQLIGKVKKSSSQTNEEIMHEISHSNHSIDIDSMESLGSTSSSFICLDLSYTLASANQKNILTNLLEHNQFEYFEIDYMMTTS